MPAGQTHATQGGLVANGPRLEEFLAEMNREVGLDRHRLITVGEMPGSTVELARPVTDPAHGELTWCSPSSTSGWTRSPAARSGTWPS